MNRFLQKITGNFNVPKKDRPGWFIDAKWIFALAFILVFATSLTSYNIMQLTNRKHAVETLTTMIEDTLNNTEGNVLQKIDEYKQSLSQDQQAADQNAANADQDKSVIGKALRLFFPEQDIQNMSSTDLKEGLLKDLAVPLYEQGTSYVFTLLKGIDYATPIDSALNKLPIYSDKTHDTLMAWFVTTLIISMILLAGVIYFSWGWGKIFNAGLVITATAMPGFIGYGYAHRFLKDVIPDIGAEGSNFFINTFVVGLIQTLEKNIKDITLYQDIWFWIGIALIIAAITGKIFYNYRKKGQSRRDKMKTEIKAELEAEMKKGKKKK